MLRIIISSTKMANLKEVNFFLVYSFLFFLCNKFYTISGKEKKSNEAEIYKAENESPLSFQLGDNSLLHNSPDFLPLTWCVLLYSTKMNNYTIQTVL